MLMERAAYSMNLPRQENDLPLSLRVIAEWEKRISQQKLLIADLRMK
jgi:hypothetical protein